MLNNKDWSEDARKQILAGLLEYASQADKEGPYRIGRLLGDIYSRGKLIDPDFKQAFDWYETAANLGNSKAMYRLGLLLLTGTLGKIETDAAIKLFESAAQKGHQKAIKELAKLGKLSDLKTEIKNEDNLVTDKPDNIDSLIHKRADFYYMLGQQYKEGYQLLNQIAEKFPYLKQQKFFHHSSDTLNVKFVLEMKSLVV
jgi:uncharacterized protein